MSVPFKGNYIAGRFVRPSKGAELISEDPGDLLEPIGRLVVSADAVEAAVAGAVRAFPRWSAVPVGERIARMRAFRRVLKRRENDLIRLLAREAGKPLAEATREVERLGDKVEEMATLGLKLLRPFSVRVGRGIQGECRWRPLGALAVIGPFNFPAHTPGSHFIPALLTGNTVVFKPSEYTPFVGQMLAECIHAAGLPAGVFHLVQGGSEVGVRLVGHPAIAGILFTGSTAAGQAIKRATLDEPHKCLALEMGGKNAALVLDDADVELAAREIVSAAYSMSGQRCNATSRVIVHRRAAKAFLKIFLELEDRVRIGYPLEPGVLMGPLVSHDAVAKFQRYMALAEDEGFETLREGKATGGWGGRRGYYVTPSVHLCERPALVHPAMNSPQVFPSPRSSGVGVRGPRLPSRGRGRVRGLRKPADPEGAWYRHDEIFGPDVAIVLARNDDEAVALNNEVPYGLITSVFTRSDKRFRRLLPRIDTGMVNLNRGTIFSSGRLPFGGTKASGSFKPAGLFSPYYCTYPVAVLRDKRPLGQRNLPV